MEQGSLPERYLSRSVIKHVRKQNKKIEVPAAIGNDYSRLNGVITADGMGDTPWIAWAKASNNFACSGGKVVGARLALMLPADIKESKIKNYMADFNAFAQKRGVQILGGHSQVSEVFSKEQFLVTLVGEAGSFLPNKKEIKDGDDIVFIGYAGQMGADVILRNHYQELSDRFSESYLNTAYMDIETYEVCNVVNALMKSQELSVLYMHDVSGGGLYGGLWQLGVWMDKGFEIIHENVPIKQETIEISEFYNINPYMLDGTGGLLVISKNGEQILEYLDKEFNANYRLEAKVIGKVTEKKEKIIVVNNVDRRCLSPVNGDEGYRLEKRTYIKNK